MARTDQLLALRDGTSILLLRDGVDGLLLNETIDVGSSISGGTFSRGRWHAIVEAEEKARQAARDERERERKRKIEAKQKARAQQEAAADAARQAAHAKLLIDLKTGAEQSQNISLQQLAAALATEFKVPALKPPTSRRPVAVPPVEREAPEEALLKEMLDRQPDLFEELHAGSAAQLKQELLERQADLSKTATDLRKQLSARQRTRLEELHNTPLAKRLLRKGKK